MNDERKSHMSSIIGETAVVLGNVSGHGDLEIRGKVQGSIELVGRVFVAEGGIVLGNIEAGTITISGEVRGDLSAGDGIVIQASGEVEGNLLAPRVGVEPGARVRGMLRTGATSSAQNPSGKDVLEEKKSFAQPTTPPFESDPAPVEDRRATVTKAEIHSSAAFAEVMLPGPLPATARTAAPLAPLSPNLPPLSPDLQPLSPDLQPLSPDLQPLSPDLQPLSPDLQPPAPPRSPIQAAATPLDRPDKPRKRRRPKKPGQAAGSAVPATSNKPDVSGTQSARASVSPPAAPVDVRPGAGDKKPAQARQKGPPKPPTFTKGTKGHQRG